MGRVWLGSVSGVALSGRGWAFPVGEFVSAVAGVVVVEARSGARTVQDASMGSWG